MAASGRRPGLLHGRLPRSEAGIHTTWAGGGGSNCQHQRGVRGSPQSSPSPPQNSTCKLGRKIVEIWLLEGPNPSLYGTRKPRIPFPVQS